MDIGKILQRSWDVVWKHRAVWFFGIILAFTTSGSFWWLYGLDRGDVPLDTMVKITETTTIYLPGEGLVVDFTTPEGVTVYVENWGQLEQVWADLDLVEEVIPPEIWTVITVAAIWLAVLILVSTIGRYASRAAVITMVEKGESTGDPPGIRQGLKMGFSRNAWRLFFIDLLVFFGWVLVIALMALFTGAPLLLLTTDSKVGEVIGIATSSGLFFAFVALGIIGGALVSLFVEVIRRACVQDNLGVFAGIRRGWVTVFQNFSSVLAIWGIWMGVRIAWMLAAIPVILLLTPVFLVMVIAGALIAAVPALIVGGLTSLLVGGAWPWIAAGLVGIPVFIGIVGLPLAFVSGLVEIFKSNLWTIAYRDIRPLESEIEDESTSALPADLTEAGAAAS